MKSNKIILRLSFIYMVITSFISTYYYFFILMAVQNFGFLHWALLFISGVLVISTLVINLLILVKEEFESKNLILFNVVICGLQSVLFLFNHFQLRYNQGFEWIVYVNFNSDTNAYSTGMNYPFVNFNVDVNWWHLSNYLVGINLIALSLMFIFLDRWKTLKAIDGATHQDFVSS